MEGPHRHLDCKPQEQAQEDDVLKERRRVYAGFTKLDHVECAGVDPQRQESQQHEDRPEQREQEEFDGSVFPARPAPDADHEVHGNQDHLEEDEEQHQVERYKGPRHPRLEQQDESDECLDLAGLRHMPPGIDQAQKGNEQRQEEQRKRYPVQPDVVVRIDLRDPLCVRLELDDVAAGSVVEPERDDHSHDQCQACEGCSYGKDHLLARAGKKE
jgi:hypothetical protein